MTNNPKFMVLKFVIQLDKKFCAFYKMWRFITMFTTGCYWSLSYVKKINSVHILPPHFYKIQFNIILLSLPTPSILLLVKYDKGINVWNEAMSIFKFCLHFLQQFS
jgi:hypothetical protein